jgi:hypothetical protein
VKLEWKYKDGKTLDEVKRQGGKNISKEDGLVDG